ncbi:MAG TPA: alpha/beta family hydrolase [Gemmatimonadales bacterium]
MSRELTITVGESVGAVSALLDLPAKPSAVYVLAHGAGAGMTHPFMADIAARLVSRKIGVLRYQFPYMENKKGRPDPPAVAEATVRAAVQAAAKEVPGVKIIAGGKSFGARMTSQASANGKIPDAKGLVFLGFPLHPPKQPSDTRAAHLAQVSIPMLFLQGTRDDLADLTLLTPIIQNLSKATLHIVPGGDHSFKLLKRDGGGTRDVMEDLAEAIEWWVGALER